MPVPGTRSFVDEAIRSCELVISGLNDGWYDEEREGCSVME